MVGRQPSILYEVGDRHERRSTLVSDALREVDPFELHTHCERHADALIDEFCGRARADLVEEYAMKLPALVLARVFGVLQFFLLTALGIGGVLAPVLSDAFGLENALIISGLFLPVLVLLFGRTVAKIDAQAAAPESQELRLLTGVPIFNCPSWPRTALTNMVAVASEQEESVCCWMECGASGQ